MGMCLSLPIHFGDLLSAGDRIQKGLTPGNDFLSQRLRFAAGLGVGDAYLIRQGRHEFVAENGEMGRYTAMAPGKWRKEKEAAPGQRRPPFRGIRIPLRLRPGQMIRGCLPRRRMRRHSFSIGEWNPLMTVIPAWRNPRARS